MPLGNSGLPSPYGLGQQTQNDGSLLVDTEDGVNAVVPSFKTDGSGNLAPGTFDPRQTWQTIGGVSPLNAILVELRVMNALLHHQLGDTRMDLNQMRADEYNNQGYGTGQM